MNIHKPIFKRGELKRRVALCKTLLDSSYDKNNFITVRILTLQAHADEIALELWLNYSQTSPVVFVKEFVKITDDFVEVGVNYKTVNKQAEHKALFLLAKVNAFDQGIETTFGQSVKIQPRIFC